MTKRELIDYCLTYISAFEDYPFDETTAVIKHFDNKKMFALIDIMNDKLYINLKCDPMKADILRGVYESVIPGWHMNQTHWNTVYVNGNVPEQELHDMIAHSYDLTKPKSRKNVSKEAYSVITDDSNNVLPMLIKDIQNILDNPGIYLNRDYKCTKRRDSGYVLEATMKITKHKNIITIWPQKRNGAEGDIHIVDDGKYSERRRFERSDLTNEQFVASLRFSYNRTLS